MRQPAIPHASARSIRAAKEVITPDAGALLTVDEAAERLRTGVRFIRRLIQERRIQYVKVGRHVRIPDAALNAYIAERTVPSLREARSSYRKAA